MPATSRRAIPYPAGTDPVAVPQDILDAITPLDDVALDDQGLLAARPAAGTFGNYYWATDGGPGGTGGLYRDNGTTWILIGPSAISADSITATELAPDSVTATELADHAVTDASRAVTTNHIRDAAVTAAKLAAGAVGAAAVADALKPSAGAAAATETLRALGATSSTAAAGNDSRFPTASEKAALVGTEGTPSALNPFVTDDDTRLAGIGTPDDGSVTTAKIVDLNVTEAKIAAGAIVGSKISDTLKPSVSAAAGTESLRALGTTSSTAAAGNDSRFPTADQKAALAGSSGSPSAANLYVTAADARLWETGDIRHSAVPTARTGWALCDGSAVARSGGEYAALFGVIGTAYGAGNGTTTFNLPDYRGRAIFGIGTHADVNALSDNDGLSVASRKPDHTHSGPSHSHSLPNHSHSVNIRSDATDTADGTSENGTTVARVASSHTHMVTGNTGNPNSLPDTGAAGTGQTGSSGPSYGTAYVYIKL